jgi:hypothetical protein
MRSLRRRRRRRGRRRMITSEVPVGKEEDHSLGVPNFC